MKIGVWTPFRAGGSLGPPEELPLGRAALALAHEGVELVIGRPVAAGRFSGVQAIPGAWRPLAEAPVQAVYDRFPSASRADEFASGLTWIRGLPLANPPSVTELCRDKWRCQQALAGVPQPDVALDAFEAHLADWGAAFLKPRHGSFGRGVRRVVPGDHLPDADGSFVLQRAVSPPPEFGAGLALRILVQRVDGVWRTRPAVARISLDDPVVNAARGADVQPAEDRLPTPTLDAAEALALDVAQRLGEGDRPVVELGVDVVIDESQRPWLIEVNSRPRGRLRALAALYPERFAVAHTEACIAPFRSLASVVPSG